VAIVAATCALALGCQSELARDLGSTEAELNAATPAEVRPQDFVGRWLGTVADPLDFGASGEAAPLHFASGSALVTLEVHGDGVQPDRFASLTFGEGEPPLPAADPSELPVGIPPAWADADPFNTPPLEGFPYALSPEVLQEEFSDDIEIFGLGHNDFALVDGILRLGFFTDEIFLNFCLSQPGGSLSPVCECAGGVCFPHVTNPVALWLRHTSTGLAGVFVGHIRVPNERGGITSLGQIQLTAAGASLLELRSRLC
jgi:hypothetical protein